MAPPLALVVEDEFLVRINALSLLQKAGFGVIKAGSADEAIALLESRKDIRIVFTDINMPEAWTDYDLRMRSAVSAHQSSLCLRLARCEFAIRTCRSVVFFSASRMSRVSWSR